MENNLESYAWWTCGSLSRVGVVLEALFLGSSRVYPTLWMACERLPRTWTAHSKHTRDIRGLT
jgi:hypothetical protein